MRVCLLLIIGWVLVIAAGCGRNGSGSGRDDDRPGEGGGTPLAAAATQARLSARGDAAADPAGFVRGLTQELTGALFNAVSDNSSAINTITDLFGGDITSRTRAGLTLNVPRAEVNRWRSEFPEIGEFVGLIELVANSGISLEFESRMSDDFEFVATLAWRLSGQRMLSAEFIFTNNRMYMGIPELYDRFIVVDFRDLGLDISYFFADMGELEEIMEIVDDTLALLARHERAITRAMEDAVAAALAEITRITVTNGVSVQANNRTVTYNEINITLTETELINAARAALQSLYDSEAAINATVEIINYISRTLIGPWAVTHNPGTIRTVLDGVIGELDPRFFGDEELLSFQLYLHPGSNAITGAQFEIDDMLMRFFFDIAHGFEILVYEKGGTRFRLHGALSGNTSNFSGDIRLELVEYRWHSHWSPNTGWTSTWGRGLELNGRLATFDIRYTDWNRYSIRLGVDIADIFYLIDENPADLLPPLFANYVNNAAITLTLEAAGDDSRVALEVRERVSNMYIRLEMASEQNVAVTVNRPAYTLSLDNIDVLLGRDLFVILGNIGALIERIEYMGFDVSMLDMLLADLF